MKNPNSSNTIDKRYINIKQLSKYTSIPIKTLYEWASIRKIPSIKIGRLLLFDLYDIDDIMSSLKRHQIQSEEKANNIIGDIQEKEYNTVDSSHTGTIRHVKGGE